MSTENNFKSNFFDKIVFDEKTRTVRDDDANGIVEAIMAGEFEEHELEATTKVMAHFHNAASGLFSEATSVMQKTFAENEELGSLSLDVNTRFGNLEVAMNRPEGGFTKDNIASATGLGIKHELDNDSFSKIYTDLESVFTD